MIPVPGKSPQRCSFLFPPLFNKIFSFYIVCLGFARGKRGGHQNTMKTHEFGGIYFHLKKCGHHVVQKSQLPGYLPLATRLISFEGLEDLLKN